MPKPSAKALASKRKKVSFARRRARVGRARVSRTTVIRQPQVSSVVATGIKNLVGLLPYGNALTKAADFVFKAIGWTPAIVKDPDTTSGTFPPDADIYNLGLTTVACVRFSALLCGSRMALPVTESGQWRTSVTVGYQHIRVQSVTIKYWPSTKMGSMQGEVCLCFVPQVLDAQSDGGKPPALITYEEMSRLPGAVSGLASKPLFMTVNANGNMYWSRWNEIGWNCGFLCLAYQNLNRDEYTDFKPSEFGPQFELSGRFELNGKLEGVANDVYTCTEMIKPCYKSVRHLIIAQSDTKDWNGFYYVTDPNYSCKKVSGKIHCAVTGLYSRRIRQKDEVSDLVDSFVAIPPRLNYD